jgi:hypothetical protein
MYRRKRTYRDLKINVMLSNETAQMSVPRPRDVTIW